MVSDAMMTPEDYADRMARHAEWLVNVFGPVRHDINCEYHADQYPHECTCGATRPRAPWFVPHAAPVDERPAPAGWGTLENVR